MTFSEADGIQQPLLSSDHYQPRLSGGPSSQWPGSCLYSLKSPILTDVARSCLTEPFLAGSPSSTHAERSTTHQVPRRAAPLPQAPKVRFFGMFFKNNVLRKEAQECHTVKSVSEYIFSPPLKKHAVIFCILDLRVCMRTKAVHLIQGVAGLDEEGQESSLYSM